MKVSVKTTCEDREDTREDTLRLCPIPLDRSNICHGQP
jgi:hypothetical protein